MGTKTLTLSEKSSIFIEKEIKEFGLKSASAYFEALIKSRQKQKALDTIDGLMSEALKSGTPIKISKSFIGQNKIRLNDIVNSYKKAA
jgi:uncharacterized protein YoaH (UPF0181 family)